MNRYNFSYDQRRGIYGATVQRSFQSKWVSWSWNSRWLEFTPDCCTDRPTAKCGRKLERVVGKSCSSNHVDWFGMQVFKAKIQGNEIKTGEFRVRREGRLFSALLKKRIEKRVRFICQFASLLFLFSATTTLTLRQPRMDRQDWIIIIIIICAIRRMLRHWNGTNNKKSGEHFRFCGPSKVSWF